MLFEVLVMIIKMMNKSPKKDFLRIRIASMILDHFFMTFILTIVVFLIGGLCFGIFRLTETTTESLPEYFPIFFLPIVFLVFSIYMNKDGIKGKSPAKRILGLIVIDNKTKKVATPIKSLLRNVTLFVWPIEVIFTFYSTERRLGDYIAGTRVVLNQESLETEIKLTNLILAIFIGGLFLVPLILIQALIIGFNPFVNYM